MIGFICILYVIGVKMCRDDKLNFTESYKIIKTIGLTFLTPQDSKGYWIDSGILIVEHTEKGCTFYYKDRESIDIVHPYLENMLAEGQIEKIK